jgi:hypothetical protein
MKHPIQLVTMGGWGAPDPPALAFDLSGPAAWKSSQKYSARRYGKAPTSGDDTRPMAPAHRHVIAPGWNVKIAYQVGISGTAPLLRDITAPFGGGTGIQWTSTDKTKKNFFILPGALAANESIGIRAKVSPIDSKGTESNGHIWHYRVGKAGRGVLFQIRDGKPEIARLSTAWTRAKEDSLRTLWALADPTTPQETQMASLQKEIYATFESLDLERTTGRDNFLGAMFLFTLIPDPKGGLQVVLGSADAVQIEPLEGVADLWDAGAAIEVGGTGGGWTLQNLGVRFATATLDFGPYSGDDSAWDNATYTSSAFAQKDANGNYLAHVAFSRTSYNGGAQFGFRASFTSNDNRYGAWLYNVSARLENGPRSGLNDTEITLDTDDLTNLPSYLTPDVKPIMSVSLSCEENGTRHASIVIRDIKGRTTQNINAGIDGLVGRVCNLTSGFVSLLKNALIVRGRLLDAAHFALETEGEPRRLGIDVSKATSSIELDLCDGRQLLEETLCDPPIISDGFMLGTAVRQRLRLAGYSWEEMARVPASLGPRLPMPLPGEPWAIITDPSDSVNSSIDALLDRFGLDLRFYQDTNGVWVLEKVPSTVVAAFTSDSKKNDPKRKRVGNGGTRLVVLSPLDWERDNSDFYNIFKVVGGVNGEITRTWVDDHSMRLGPGGVAHSRWVGRPKVYPTLTDTGLRTVGAVLLALRSLRFRYNKPGRCATFVTYFEKQFAPLDRITIDGVLCEVMSWTADVSGDRMQIRVREIV